MIGAYAIFVSIATVITVLAFLWALRARQFEDQERARFLALDGTEPPIAATARKSFWNRESAPLVIVAVVVLCLVACAIWIVIAQPGGGA